MILSFKTPVKLYKYKLLNNLVDQIDFFPCCQGTLHVSIAFWPWGRHSRPHNEGVSVASRVSLAPNRGCLEEPPAHPWRTNCLLSTCLQKFSLHRLRFPRLAGSVSDWLWKAFVRFSCERLFFCQRFETYLSRGLATLLSRCLACPLHTVASVRIVTLRQLVKKIKTGYVCELRLVNKACQVQKEDGKYHFNV